MREPETSLQQVGEFVLKAQLVNEKAAPYCVRWVAESVTWCFGELATNCDPGSPSS